MPAALQLETMTQLGGLILLLNDREAEYIYVRKINDSTFYQMIRPEQKLFAEVEIISGKRGVFNMKGIIGDEDDFCYSKASFSQVNPREIVLFQR